MCNKTSLYLFYRLGQETNYQSLHSSLGVDKGTPSIVDRLADETKDKSIVSRIGDLATNLGVSEEEDLSTRIGSSSEKSGGNTLFELLK